MNVKKKPSKDEWGKRASGANKMGGEKREWERRGAVMGGSRSRDILRVGCCARGCGLMGVGTGGALE